MVMPRNPGQSSPETISVPMSLLRRFTEALERLAQTAQQERGRRPFNPLFEARFVEGDTIRVHKADGAEDIHILAVGALPYRRWDAGSLSSASSLAVDPTTLDMPAGEMAQYRFFVRDAFEVELTHPGTTVRQWKSDTTNWRIPPVMEGVSGLSEAEVSFLWAASEFWVFEDQTPRFDFYRLAGVTVEMHIDFSGIRYAFETFATMQTRGITPPLRPAYDLWANAWPAVSGK